MDLTHTEITTQKRRRGWFSQPVETQELSDSGTSGRRRAPRRPWTGVTAIAVLGLIGLASGCKVPQPTVRQGLDYDFRTPKQAFESWRTAVQGDLLAEEYRCFSRLWRNKNGGVSLLGYGEARDRILEEYPHLQWAVYKAEAPEVLARTDRDCLLLSKIPGPLWVKDRYLLVRLRRQGFWDLSVEDSPRQPEFGDEFKDPFREGVFYFDDQGDRFFVIINDFAAHTGLSDAGSIHLASAGWEWKIDEFRIVDEPPDAGQFLE